MTSKNTPARALSQGALVAALYVALTYVAALLMSLLQLLRYLLIFAGRSSRRD